MHWIWLGLAEAGLVLYFAAAWLARCPECATPLWRSPWWSDIDPQCPECGHNRYAGKMDADPG